MISTTINPPRVVVTGWAAVTPLGTTVEQLYDGLLAGRSGIARSSILDGLHVFPAAGIARDFHGNIDDFGPLNDERKRAIRKGLKLMCREVQMGVAAAQLALHHSALDTYDYDPDRSGVVFGCDHIVTVPDEFAAAFTACSDQGRFDFEQWGTRGISEITPLWLLKYLPNMPASHIAIYNDLRGANNSVTYRDASSNLAIGEGLESIMRRQVDRTIVGATGSSTAPFRAIQLSLNAPWAQNGMPAERLCRPFDVRRAGMVAAEGAGALVLEDAAHAEARGASIYGEILGHGSSMVIDQNSVADVSRAMSNAIQAALRRAGLQPSEIGHVHAHGAATLGGDLAEAEGIRNVLGRSVPITTAKGAVGNLGAAGGVVALVASLLAIQRGRLFPIMNCELPDPACDVHLATSVGMDPGTIVLNLSYTLQGHASVVIARGFPH